MSQTDCSFHKHANLIRVFGVERNRCQYMSIVCNLSCYDVVNNEVLNVEVNQNHSLFKLARHTLHFLCSKINK